MRVVVDTNVLVSGIINPRGAPGQILDRIQTGRLEIVATPHLWTEFLTVLRGEKIKAAIRRRRTDQEVGKLLQTLAAAIASVPEVAPQRNWVPEDPADDWVIQCAVTAHAARIISGDRDLLTLGMVEGIPVRDPRSFLDEISP